MRDGKWKNKKLKLSISGSSKKTFNSIEQAKSKSRNTVVIEKKKVPLLSANIINNVLESFLGNSLQMPPMFSAKKVNGQRLYKLARQNIEVKRDPIKICIDHIKLTDFRNNIISFSVKCSKGTYIRVLGKDIAEKLNTVGSLISLKRTGVGSFSINDSVRMETLESEWKSLGI